MAQRATAEHLRKLRTKTVTIVVEDEPHEFVIAKIKAGQRRRLQTDCIDEDGILDLEHATRLSCEMCTVEPELTQEDVEEIDLDVLLQLAREISRHSGLLGGVRQAATADPQEGTGVVKSFRLEGPEGGMGDGVEPDPAGAPDGVDA